MARNKVIPADKPRPRKDFAHKALGGPLKTLYLPRPKATQFNEPDERIVFPEGTYVRQHDGATYSYQWVPNDWPLLVG